MIILSTLTIVIQNERPVLVGGSERDLRVVEGAGFNLSCSVAVAARIDSKV